MCSILGFWGHHLSPSAVIPLNALLAHRGPDHNAVEQITPTLIFAHNRLAIVGLEQASNQPFWSADGRFALVYNGEIYNYVEIRTELTSKGHTFRTQSDTEVLLAAWAQWGEDALHRLNGMFAFAVYDEHDNSLTLARDRLGVKPLYYSWKGEKLAFSSELTPLAAALHGLNEDPVAADLFFMLGYIPAPKTIYREIHKLEPAHLLRLHGGRVEHRCYWRPLLETRPAPEGEVLEELDDLLRDAVRLRLRADVPVGAFLSGGIDSSLIVAYMRDLGGDVRTFNIGFDDPTFDESADAEFVAHRLHTQHTAEILNASSLVAIESILPYFGEPFADTSAIPTFYVARLARRHVKVALSGDGGDEFFMGYDRNKSFKALQVYQRIPTPFRSMAEALAAALVHAPGPIAEKARLFRRLVGFRIDHNISYHLDKRTLVPAERRRALHGHDADGRAWAEAVYAFNDLTQSQKAIAIDVVMSLPDDMLVKVDRMSMAHALEVRSPLLDYRLAEFALSIPERIKMPWFRTKHLLKKLAERRFGKAFCNRPKRGFAIPLEAWLPRTPELMYGSVAPQEAYLRFVYHHFKASMCLKS